jgi:AcrR family transcriptional regulator
MIYSGLSISKGGRNVAYATVEVQMAQNKQPPEDLRVRRTRKLLFQALIELAIEKGFAAITVQEIADRAMVNRATFYRHYFDKHDLLDAYMREVYELTASQEQLPAAPPHAEADGPPAGTVRMLEHVWQHADFYRVMLGAQGDPAFVARIRGYSELRLRSLMPSDATPQKPDSPPRDLCLSYLAHAGIGVLAWWLQAEQPHPPEQIATWLNQLNKATLEYVTRKGAMP